MVINLKFSQRSAAGENKPRGSFCVGLNIGLSSEEHSKRHQFDVKLRGFLGISPSKLLGNKSILAESCVKLEKKCIATKNTLLEIWVGE